MNLSQAGQPSLCATEGETIRMKRLHLSLNVTDLSASVAFYSHLFGHEPTLQKADYAQWLLDDPCVNFVLEPSATS
ncbi:MAG: VOC family protein, partial [Pseudomonadales bacterium]